MKIGRWRSPAGKNAGFRSGKPCTLSCAAATTSTWIRPDSFLCWKRFFRRMKELYNGYRSAAAFGSVDPVFHAGRRAAPEGLQGDRGRGGVGHIGFMDVVIRPTAESGIKEAYLLELQYLTQAAGTPAAVEAKLDDACRRRTLRRETSERCRTSKNWPSSLSDRR